MDLELDLQEFGLSPLDLLLARGLLRHGGGTLLGVVGELPGQPLLVGLEVLALLDRLAHRGLEVLHAALADRDHPVRLRGCLVELGDAILVHLDGLLGGLQCENGIVLLRGAPLRRALGGASWFLPVIGLPCAVVLALKGVVELEPLRHGSAVALVAKLALDGDVAELEQLLVVPMAPLDGSEKPFAARRAGLAQCAWALGAGGPVAGVVDVVLGRAIEVDLVPARVLEHDAAAIRDVLLERWMVQSQADAGELELAVVDLVADVWESSGALLQGHNEGLEVLDQVRLAIPIGVVDVGDGGLGLNVHAALGLVGHVGRKVVARHVRYSQ